MRKLGTPALSAAALLSLAGFTGCGSVTTKTVTEKSAAPQPRAETASQTTTTEAAPAVKPTVDISWDSPEQTAHDQITLKGTVSYGAHVKVSGHRAAVTGTHWSKVVKIKKH